MLLDAVGCRPREAYVGLLEAGCLEVWGNEPEDGVGTREGLVDDVGVAVGALDDLDALAYVGGDLGWVADDHTNLFAAFEEVFENLVADSAGGSGDDDHCVFSIAVVTKPWQLYRRYSLVYFLSTQR